MSKVILMKRFIIPMFTLGLYKPVYTTLYTSAYFPRTSEYAIFVWVLMLLGCNQHDHRFEKMVPKEFLVVFVVIYKMKSCTLVTSG